MNTFKQFLTESKIMLDVWHVSRAPFEIPFDEEKQGIENDEGYSGKGFYFADESYFEKGFRGWYKRKFRLRLNKVFNLDQEDVFSGYDGPNYVRFRDEKTLELLKEGYEGTIRTLNGKLDEICVLSYKAKGFDGNKYISTIEGEDWELIE